MIRAIVAVDEKYGIAKDGKIPWHCPEDLEFFRITTIGKGNNAVVMGRVTSESIPSFPLKDRTNYVLSGRKIKLKKFVKRIKDYFDDIYLIGGQKIYEQAIQQKVPEEFIITRIRGIYDCDCYLNHNMLSDNFFRDSVIEKPSFNIEIWKRKEKK